jgi:hypothetical protein
MVSLWADGDVGAGSARLLLYHHESDYFNFEHVTEHFTEVGS